MKRKLGINPERAIKDLRGFYLGVAAFFGALSVFVTMMIKTPERDLFNATALVLEIGFAIAITWTVYLYSKKWNLDNQRQQNQIAELISEIKKIENRQEKIIEAQESSRQRRHDWAINTVRSAFPAMQHHLAELKPLIEGINNNPEDGVTIEFKIKAYSDAVNEIAKDTKTVIEHSVDVLDPVDVKDVLWICEASSNIREIGQFRHVIKDLFPGYISKMDEILERLPNPSV